MTALSRVAVIGDQTLCEKVRAALAEHGITPLDPGLLEIRDEFQVRRWFLEQNPTHVFVCPGIRGQTSVGEFTFTIVGTINVLMASLGISERVRMLVQWPTMEHFLLRRLCELLHFDSKMDCCDIVAHGRETVTEFVRRAVLEMRDVSAKEANTRRGKSSIKGREVRSEVVSQQAGAQQHGPNAAPVLEVPLQAAQAQASGNLRAQRAPAAGQEAQNPVFDNAGGI
jgi:hypothetical protein